MINFAAIVNVRNLPLLSPYGLAMIVFYAIAALLFFIPTALISAELASVFTEEGGLFTWVNRAIGQKTAFFCEWVGFITTVTALTTTMVCLVTSMALTLNPTLCQNKILICSTVICGVWTATVLASKGTNFASKIVSVASVMGTILPIFILFLLGIYWICSGKPIAMDLSPGTICPDFKNFSNISFLAGIMFAFAGIEMSAYYVKDVKNPRRTYPLAIFCSAALILLVSLLGSLLIALVVPREDLILSAGVMQAITAVLEVVHGKGLAPLFGFLIVTGGIAYVFAWIAGPVRGLYAVRHTGLLPPFLGKVDDNGMPIAILYYQAVMVTILAVLFLLVPSVSLCFWIINVSAAVLILMLYACLFASGIILRYKMPDGNRAYKIPGGNFGMILLGTAGLLNVIFCMVISFFIPSEMRGAGMSQSTFAWLVFLATALMGSPPFLFIAMSKPHWKR
ncbi:MAG: APC family permease [Puniceicoccales bacterium]|jgi:amino acid transporter|nr:APC family permease [Puniceicoccales bacterium]